MGQARTAGPPDSVSIQDHPEAEPPPSWLTERVMGQSGSENFPVASRFLPRDVRDHLLAIYGFARLVDDLGDEAPGDRSRLLDWLENEVRLVYEGEPTHPLMRRLAPTVQRFGIPRRPFARLIAANRQDQTVRSYATFDDLAAYCDLSANPVGHLVLYVLEASTPERMGRSDAVCTGLQLVEHWQDVAEDLDRGRVYLPQEDLDRFGCTREDLAARPAVSAFRRLMAFEVGRAADLLDRGAPLARDLGGRAGLAVAGFVAGGRSALDAIARAGYDVLSKHPRPSSTRRIAAMVRTIAVLWLPRRARR
jgi:squalene synthase HpnC